MLIWIKPGFRSGLYLTIVSTTLTITACGPVVTIPEERSSAFLPTTEVVPAKSILVKKAIHLAHYNSRLFVRTTSENPKLHAAVVQTLRSLQIFETIYDQKDMESFLTQHKHPIQTLGPDQPANVKYLRQTVGRFLVMDYYAVRVSGFQHVFAIKVTDPDKDETVFHVEHVSNFLQKNWVDVEPVLFPVFNELIRWARQTT